MAEHGSAAGEPAPGGGRPRWLDAVLVFAVCGLVVAGVVNVIQHGARGVRLPKAVETKAKRGALPVETTTGSSGLPERAPAFVALPAELRQAGGLLWWSSADCSAGWLDLGLGRTHRIPGRHCRIWPSPDGSRAVMVTTRRGEALAGHGLRFLQRDGGAQHELGHTPGYIASDLSWSRDGSAVAACIGTHAGPVVDLVDIRGARSISGVCQTGWTAEGWLVSAVPTPPRVSVGDRTVLSPAQAAELLPEVPKGAKRVVSAIGAAGGRIVVGLIVTTPKEYLPLESALVVLSDTGREVFRTGLAGHFPAAVGLSADGTALWYLDATEGRAKLVAIPGGRRLTPFGALWFTWSPDGRYLAAALDEGVDITSWPDRRPVATIAIRTAGITWTLAD